MAFALNSFGQGGVMKVLTKLLADFVAWRWAPTVGLLSASVLFVLIVVGLVPSEIGVPVANSKFSPKPRATSTAGLSPEATTALATNSDDEPTAARIAPSPVPEATPLDRPADFGRRGFSPVLDRPDPPPMAAPPPPAPPIPVMHQPAAVAEAQVSPAPAAAPPQSRVGALFQRVQSAFGGGSSPVVPPPQPPQPQPQPQPQPPSAAEPVAPPNGAPPSNAEIPPNAEPPAGAAPPNGAAPPAEAAPPNGAVPPNGGPTTPGAPAPG
jgi:hypothetical protein